MLIHFTTDNGNFAFVRSFSDLVGKDIVFSIIGFVKELKEEDLQGVVDETWIGNKTNIVYRDYNGSDTWNCNTAKESIKTLMDSLEIYLENPLGNIPPHNLGLISTYPTGNSLMDYSLLYAKKWVEIDARTNEWLLIKLK